jgi:hypothetical protein
MLTRGAIALLLVVILYLVVKVDWSTLLQPAGPAVPAPQPQTIPTSWARRFAQLLQGPLAAWTAIQGVLGPASLLLVLPIIAAVVAWITAPGRPFSAYLQRRHVNYRPQFIRLLVQASRINPFLDRDFSRQVQILRRPRMVDSQELDIDATLTATLHGVGLFSPVFARRRVAPEYLVFIDRRSRHDHLAAYAEALVAAFQHAVYVSVYYYNEDVRRLHASVDSPAVTLEEVAARYSDHRLILVGSGDRFFDPMTGALLPWSASIKVFARRVFLTSVPPDLWGYRERELQRGLDTQVLPLTPQAIPGLIGILNIRNRQQAHGAQAWHDPAPLSSRMAAEVIGRINRGRLRLIPIERPLARVAFENAKIGRLRRRSAHGGSLVAEG